MQNSAIKYLQLEQNCREARAWGCLNHSLEYVSTSFQCHLMKKPHTCSIPGSIQWQDCARRMPITPSGAWEWAGRWERRNACCWSVCGAGQAQSAGRPGARCSCSAPAAAGSGRALGCSAGWPSTATPAADAPLGCHFGSDSSALHRGSAHQCCSICHGGVSPLFPGSAICWTLSQGLEFWPGVSSPQFHSQVQS